MCVSEWHPAAATILANLCFLCASNAAIDQYVSVLISFAKMQCSNQQNTNCKVLFLYTKTRSLGDPPGLADCPTMSFVFVCWHSRKWWPPIRGGTLQSALLRLEKVKWSDFVCKKGFAHTNCRWKIKKQDKKWAKTLQKGCFFQPSQLLAQNSWNEGSLMSMSIFPPLWLFFDPKEAYVWTHLNLEWHLLHHLWAASQGPQGSFREPLPCPGVSIPKFNKEQRLTVIFIDHQESNYMY